MLIYYLSAFEFDEDKELFCKVYESYHDSMYRASLYLCEDIDDAEDLLQETFTKVAIWIDKRHSVPLGSLYSWLIVIMKHAHIDWYRKNSRIIKADFNEEFYIYEQDFTSKVLSDNEFERIISQLSEPEKELLRMKFLYKFSGKDIAAVLGITCKCYSNS